MTRRKFFFFCDLSPSAGFGHLMRSEALASQIIKRGYEVIFYTDYLDEKARNYLKKKKIKFFQTKRNINDFFITKSIFSISQSDVVIFDHYKLTLQSMKKVKNSGIFLVIIDDFGNKKIIGDIIINQNLGVDKKVYKKYKISKLLIGSKYCLIRDDIKRIKGKKLKKIGIFITFGGGKFNNLIYRFLNFIRRLDEILKIKIKIFIVTDKHNKRLMLKFFKNLKNIKIVYLVGKFNLSKYISVCDFSINTGGVTLLEMIYLRVPQMTIMSASNQKMNTSMINKLGVGINIGNLKQLKEKIFIKQILNFIFNKKMKTLMKLNSKKIVDGHGTKRTLNEILKLTKKN